MKTLRSLVLAAAAVGLVAAAPLGAFAQDKGTVGIAMPTKSSARWIDDGNNMVKQFEAAGYGANLQYAEDDIPNQLSQVENMITTGVSALVIASIDGTTLSNTLANAAAAKIPVIAYDRLIRDTPNVDYYATFDNFQGRRSPGAVARRRPRRQGRQGPFNVELFGGSPDDNNAFFFYNGAMSVPAASDRQGHPRREERPDGHGQGRHAALGRLGRPGPHGEPPVGLLHRRQGRCRAVAL